MARPITNFSDDLSAAQTPNPARFQRLERLTQDVDQARTALNAAIEALAAAVNEHAGLQRAGRILRDLGYEVPGEPGPTLESGASVPGNSERAK